MAGQVLCLFKQVVQDLRFHLQQPLKKSWDTEM